MPNPRRALIAAATLSVVSALSALPSACAAPAPPADAGGALAEPLGVFVWREADEDFGGLSGFELSADGSRFWALSDRGTLRWGKVERDAQGRVTGMTGTGKVRLQNSKGGALKPGRLGDAEGLAIDDQGRIFVSFEGADRVLRYDDAAAPAKPLPSAKQFRQLRKNGGLEALAVTPEGELLTMPEVWGQQPGGVPVWRLRDGRWDTAFQIPSDPDWARVGADVGPDGMLYVLERDFLGLGGFASRVRRFAMDGDRMGPPQLLFQSSPRQFDNLEGIAVWQDGKGIRVTMVSDDNFLFLQQTQVVEFRVPAP